MLKIGLLGVGQMGASVIGEAVNMGFENTGIIYTSDVDIGFTEKVTNKLKLIGYSGASKNRDIGHAAVVDNLKEVVDFIKSVYQDCDVLFIVGSSGGGTASGGVPVITEIALGVVPVVSCITSLPFAEECTRCQMNSLEFTNEITINKDLSNIYIIDNKKVKEMFIDYTKEDIFKYTNQTIISLIKSLNIMTSIDSRTSSFDEEEALDILSERGVSIISEIIIDENVKSSSSLNSQINKSLKESIFCDIEDSKIVKAALLFTLDKDLQKYINIRQILNGFDDPETIHEAYYLPSEEKRNSVLVILSGLSLPNKRLDEMRNLSLQKEELIMKNIESTRNQKYDLKENWTKKIERRSRKLKPIDNVLSKYNVK